MEIFPKNSFLPSFSSGFAASAAREAKASKPGLKAGRNYIAGNGFKKTILALGAESAGNFSVFFNPPTSLLRGGSLLPPFEGEGGGIYLSEDFGDLLDDKNFIKFKKSVLSFLKKNKLKPDVILTDLHPEYRTTLWGEELSKKFSAQGGSASGGKAEHIKIQHHHAHIFSAFGEHRETKSPIGDLVSFAGIALDGTGYGLDGKIWGGEVFQITNSKSQISNKFKIQNSKFKIQRIGHLENQIMIGGDLAVREPARMLLAILDGIKNYELRIKNNKEFVYKHIKKFYTKNQFELLYNQLQQNFNCVETSSTGRILDAVSLLLGFCGNKRNYKHEPIDLLEKNSSLPYKINSKLKTQNSKLILQTTPLFEYLIKNLHKDKKRLAATAQLYIAQGLYKITKSYKLKATSYYLSGGIANSKIISKYLESKGIIANPIKYNNAYTHSPATKFNGVNKKIPRGDAGLSFGQIYYYLFFKKL